MDIKIYSTPTCGKCVILKNKLKDKKIEFEEIQDMEIMADKFIRYVPVLEVDGMMMDFRRANEWVNAYGNDNKGSE